MAINTNSLFLSIGVGKRKEDSDAMAITSEDACYFSEAVAGLCKFPREKIVTKINDDALVRVILKELDIIIEKTKQQLTDLVIIYFSGHGCVINGQYYLICRDTSNDDIQNTAIPGSEFVKKLNAIQSDKLLVVLDCCHAKGITEFANDTTTDIPFDQKLFLQARPNRVILTACHESQQSYISKPLSIFTYVLIEGLGGCYFLGNDTEVKIFELAMYVRERVAALSATFLKPKDPQAPQMCVLNNTVTSNFMLARYPNGEPKKIFFKEDFALWSFDGSKQIDMASPVKKDKAYRDRFTVITNPINVDGNGNYTMQGITGSQVTINNNSSPAELDKFFQLLNNQSKSIESLVAILRAQSDASSKQLLEKLESIDHKTTFMVPVEINKFQKEIDQIDFDIYTETVEGAVSAVESLLKISTNTKFYKDFLSLSFQLTEYKNNNPEDHIVDGEFKSISDRLCQQFEFFRKGNTSAPEENSFEEDKIFDVLCSLDFTIQQEKFRKLLDSRNFATFIIRGKDKCGQSWLLYQLMEKYKRDCKKQSDYILQDLKALSFTTDCSPLVDGILQSLESSANSKRLKAKCEKAVNVIIERSKTKNQFVILKNCFDFVCSEFFKDFFEYFIDALNIAKYDDECPNKIIVFFVEEKTERYKTGSFADCVYLEEIVGAMEQRSFFESWKTKKDFTKIIGFHPIASFDVPMLNNWLEHHASEYISPEIYPDFFPDAEGSVPDFYKKCDNGNPEEVIHYITQNLKYENQWLKY